MPFAREVLTLFTASSACFPLWKVFFECLRLCEEKELPDASRHARHLITELTWRDFFRFYAGKHGAPHGRYLFWILQTFEEGEEDVVDFLGQYQIIR